MSNFNNCLYLETFQISGLKEDTLVPLFLLDEDFGDLVESESLAVKASAEVFNETANIKDPSARLEAMVESALSYQDPEEDVDFLLGSSQCRTVAYKILKQDPEKEQFTLVLSYTT